MKNKISVYSLVLEVTRKCNMSCEHCLRGEAENMEMTKEMIDKVLAKVDYISEVTFTGGEPTLNLPIIHYFFEQAEKLNKMPMSFFIATNGKEHQAELAMELLKVYPKMEEPEMCAVALSLDQFHDDLEDNDSDILKGLSFYNTSKQNMDLTPIKEGRAQDIGYAVDKKQYPDLLIEGEIDYPQIEMLYVAANGNVVGDCDMSYEHIDEVSKYTVDNFEQAVKENFSEDAA